MKSKRILVVDEYDSVRKMLKRFLTKEGHSVTAVSSGKKAQVSFSSRKFDAVIIDVDLGEDLDGIALAEKFRRLNPKILIIVMSGDPGHQTRVKRAGFGDLLEKPFHLADIRSRLTHS